MPDIGTATVEKIDHKERLKEITDKLEQGITELFAGEKFKEYLNTMSKFHNYSFNNTMLIAMQKPDATLVAGFNTWKNKFERNVGKGEKGIQIIAPAPFKVKKEMEKIDDDTGLPMLDRKGNPIVEEVEVTIPYFKVVPVFDVSQTHGKELPTLADELQGGVTEYEKLFEALKEVSPATIEFKAITDGSKGYYHHADKAIVINEDMSQLQTVKTAIHEIAHAKLHDRDLIKADLAVAKDKQTMEVEAEAIAYTVCQHYGIDTSDYSFGYIAAWGSGKEMTELKSSLETIRSTSSEIITKIDAQMLEFNKDLAQAQEASMPEPEKSVKPAPEKTEKSAPSKPKPDKSDIIGNTAFKDIANKKYFKVDNHTAEKIAAALEELGVKFSGRISAETTTFTVDKADTAKFREAEKAATAHKIPPVQETSQGEQKTEAPEKPENPNIIGNTSFKDIADKKYMKMDTAVALRVADELEKQGIKFSGRVGGEKTTLTINATDVEICRAIAKGIREANITTPEPEQVAAEKLPDVVNPDLPQPDCSFSILQLKDVPESRDIRFEPLEALESRGIKLTNEDYNVVFSELLTATAVQNPQLLEDIFVRFNENIPDGFAGHSLSVSDVILVQNGDDVKAHYCDKVGFTEMSDFIVKEAEQFKEYPPLYLESIAYAAQNEEKHLFVESTELNNACAADIDKAILSVETNMGMPGANTYDLPKALEAVTGIYGSERVNAVVAHVVNTHDFDGRLSDDNKKWARLMETPQVEYIPLNTHLAVFDGFVNCVRAEQEKEIIIGMMLDELQNGEPEDYGGASGLAEIKETLQAKPVEELRAELKEMVVQGEIDVSEHIAEHLERNSDIHEKSEKPTLSELQSAVDKGESISLTDLAEAVKEEKIPDKPEKPAKAEKKPKKSIKGRIEADKAEKRANAEKSEPAPKKNKGEAEL